MINSDKRFVRHLSYANTVATLALFIALGGSGYAAARLTGKDIRAGTITSANIADGALRGRDIQRSTITSAHIKDETLLARDFKPGQLPRGPRGAIGPPDAAPVNATPAPAPPGGADAGGAAVAFGRVSDGSTGPPRNLQFVRNPQSPFYVCVKVNVAHTWLLAIPDYQPDHALYVRRTETAVGGPGPCTTLLPGAQFVVQPYVTDGGTHSFRVLEGAYAYSLVAV